MICKQTKKNNSDIKSSNILLNEKFIAKVGDFGLSKAMPSLSAVHISTNLRGTDGYMDPQYFRTRRATNKSDVYSFGVVLFEVLCGRAVIDTPLPEDEVSLVEWALNKKKNGELENIIDPKLQGSIKAESLRIFGELAEKCVNDKQVERPSIDYVVWNLEYALQLQVGDPVVLLILKNKARQGMIICQKLQLQPIDKQRPMKVILLDL